MLREGETNQQRKCHPILFAQLDKLSPYEIPESPLADEKVIQEEIKNGFAPLVSWTVLLIASLTSAEVAFSLYPTVTKALCLSKH